MPWVSEKQRAWGNSPTGRKELGADKVSEFNSASKGMDLPKKSDDHQKKLKAMSKMAGGY